jgi:hypothetical protein
MLLDISHAIADFVVLVTRLTTEELSDEQRMVLIDQFIHLQGFDAAFQFDLHDMLMILITMLSASFGGRGIVRTIGRIADSNRAQTLERHRSLHAVLFASRRVWLRVTKRALPGEAPARSIFKLVSQGGIPNVFKNRENSSFKPQHFPSAKFRIAFQRHGGTHHRSRPGAN